jgi:hypothetical protein
MSSPNCSTAGRARCRPYQAVARGRSAGGRARHRRPDGQAGQWPRQRSRLDCAHRHRQAGADGTGDEPENVGASATRRNRTTLKKDGIAFIGPAKGEMAESNEAGEGRMAEPLEIVAADRRRCSMSAPSRCRGARSSSPPARRMSRSTRFATSPTARPASRATPIAAALARLGADVHLVSGPVGIADPAGVKTIHVERAERCAMRWNAPARRCGGVRRRRCRLARRELGRTRRSRRSRAKDRRRWRMTENPDILKPASAITRCDPAW